MHRIFWASWCYFIFQSRLRERNVRDNTPAISSIDINIYWILSIQGKTISQNRLILWRFYISLITPSSLDISKLVIHIFPQCYPLTQICRYRCCHLSINRTSRLILTSVIIGGDIRIKKRSNVTYFFQFLISNFDNFRSKNSKHFQINISNQFH